MKDKVAITDAVTVDTGASLSTSGRSEPAPRVPLRPTESAPKAKWVEHASALGLDMRGTAGEWTKAQIIAWCGEG